MAYNKSLIVYGDRVHYSQINKSDKEIFKKKKEKEEQESLKSYLDTILPPKESTDGGEILMQFVSCQPATSREVVELSVCLFHFFINRKILINNLLSEKRKKLEFAIIVRNCTPSALMN